MHDDILVNFFCLFYLYLLFYLLHFIIFTSFHFSEFIFVYYINTFNYLILLKPKYQMNSVIQFLIFVFSAVLMFGVFVVDLAMQLNQGKFEYNGSCG